MSRRFEFGDRVRHARRPEWGIGSVVKAEEMSVNGRVAQRLSVRFPNAGLKTISTGHAELELVTAPEGAEAEGETSPLGDWEKMNESGWLGEVAQKKIEAAMVSLSAGDRDPFSPLSKRLAACLDLYRFDRSGRSLIDWAVAQSGLDDPLSRFTRHELEALFDQWASQREEHLRRLLEEARTEPELAGRLVAAAGPAARDAVRRLSADR